MLFAGITIIVVGDLYQLPSIRKKNVFDYYAFTELLNWVRTASQTDDDITIIQSRSIFPSDPNYPSDALHIWAKNAPVNEHNNKKLEEISGSLFVVKANDQYPKNASKQDIDRV